MYMSKINGSANLINIKKNCQYDEPLLKRGMTSRCNHTPMPCLAMPVKAHS